jgi:hypothetical protein
LSPNLLEKRIPKVVAKRVPFEKIRSKKRQFSKKLDSKPEKTSFFGKTNPEKMVNRVTAQNKKLPASN